MAEQTVKTYPLVTVGALIVAPDCEILFVESKKWLNCFSLPGGKVEFGETRVDAVRREVKEETGLDIINERFALTQECIFSPEFWKKSHFVMNDFIVDLAPNCKKEDVILNDEAYNFVWASPLRAKKLILNKECRILLDWYLVNELGLE